MIKTTVTCDHCKEVIERIDTGELFGIELKNIEVIFSDGPEEGGLLSKSQHFCSPFCLKTWINKEMV